MKDTSRVDFQLGCKDNVLFSLPPSFGLILVLLYLDPSYHEV